MPLAASSFRTPIQVRIIREDTMSKVYRLAFALVAAVLYGHIAFAHPQLQSTEPAGVATTPPKEIRITFSDNGRGIEPAEQARIFEPLYTTKGEIGTGLGLWVSKQIIEKHHGLIQMRSSVDGKYRGSTFSVVLPAPDDTV